MHFLWLPLLAVVPRAASQACGAIQSQLSSRACQSSATAYCSSYLGIRTVTTTVPSYLATVTIPKRTTVTTVLTVSASTTKTITGPAVTVLPTDYACFASSNSKKARRQAGIQKPQCLSTFSVAPQISSVCSCLSISAPTSTVTDRTVLVLTSTSTITKYTSTTTSTRTISTVVTPTATSTNFFLQTDDGFAWNKIVGNDRESGNMNYKNYVIQFFQNADTAHKYTLDPAACKLTDADDITATYYGSNVAGSISFAITKKGPDGQIPAGDEIVSCKVEKGTNKLYCSVGGAQKSDYECFDGDKAGVYWLGDPAGGNPKPDYCFAKTVYVAPR